VYDKKYKDKTGMEYEPSPQKIPLIFFPNASRRPAGTGVAEGTTGGGASDDRARFAARAMAMAGVHATVPTHGDRPLGDPDRSAGQAHGACYSVCPPWTFSGAAWLHQEDKGNARRRFSIGAQASEGSGAMSKKNMGSSIDDFLRDEGIFEEAQSQAVKEVVAWQLAQAMKEKKISKNRMATLLKTSRTQVDRLLDGKNDVTLSSLQRAAAMVGRRIFIQLV
jgi:predicted XRE-type DNA-binding protein